MKQLFRPKTGRMLGGVCAGIGIHLDTDPTVIRLIWAALTLQESLKRNLNVLKRN
ncbi:MAG: PspC domain-containing protein [Methanoregula sp.]|nr:PspC domain-containing protein [Methanoregula sp.]